MAKTPTTQSDVLDATTQTQINAAPTNESTAGDPRPVDTVDQPLVFNDGTPVETPSSNDSEGSFTLYHEGGTQVTVNSALRRDALLARGYTTSAPSSSSGSSSSDSGSASA